MMFGRYGYGYGGHFGFGSPWDWFGMGLGIFIHLAFTVLIVLGIIWLFRLTFHNQPAKPPANALDILKLRYAKGEITTEEFHRMKQDLNDL
ncbi:Hypothetical protein LUCI_2934 [Lucifera butyrica]|uniref:SHOCT domain-containing protein n=1 Tax=Lucifera butyrica TaxID=1351585 RepID=A0A498R913_9FIRM|nr:SHOCT domain-containing protein [Lucifera butyrica]VBB07669.1 Hypothetical protein LUCI_2934 [Lucifera butyrica]